MEIGKKKKESGRASSKELLDKWNNRYSRAYHKALNIHKKTMSYEDAKAKARIAGNIAAPKK